MQVIPCRLSRQGANSVPQTAYLITPLDELDCHQLPCILVFTELNKVEMGESADCERWVG